VSNAEHLLSRPFFAEASFLLGARLVLVLACCTALCALPVRAANAAPVAAGFRAAILIRALGYERGAASGQGDFVLAVVGGGDGASAADARTMYETFEGLSSRLTVATRSLRVSYVSHRSAAATRAELTRLRPHAVYFALGFEHVASALGDLLEPLHTVTMCADGTDLPEGCALGVQAVDRGSELVVHLGRCRKAGLSFDPRVLRLSRVIK
jgi:hypothetical protein